MTYERFDVVVVPFPFTDRRSSKRRPAVVLSDAAFGKANGNSVMAMVTSAKHSRWSLDLAIGDLAAAGLPSASTVRMKLFTLDHRLVLRKSGRLASRDQGALAKNLRALLGNT